MRWVVATKLNGFDEQIFELGSVLIDGSFLIEVIYADKQGNEIVFLLEFRLFDGLLEVVSTPTGGSDNSGREAIDAVFAERVKQ